MLYYPKMPDAKGARGGRCVAFEKLDGTNLHWSWHRDFSWHSFGTRRQAYQFLPQGFAEFASQHQHLAVAPHVFLEQLAQPLEQVLLQHFQDFLEIRVFTEFLGVGSFAGLHQASETKRLVLFDVWLEGYGFLAPEQFATNFTNLEIPRVVYQGKYTGQLAEDVRNGKFNVFEGVVVKGGTGGSDVWMAKIKTLEYLNKLKASFSNWEDFWE